VATSQNGWPAGTPEQLGGLDTSPVPGTRVRLPRGVRRGDVATVLHYVAGQFDRTVEPLRRGWNWGYRYRYIGGSDTLSNHASGTAIDLNAPEHPTGRRGTFAATQLRNLRRILAFCDGVVRWGGDYSGRPDEMHFEIVRNRNAVARLAKKIRAGQAARPVAPPGTTWVKGAWRPTLRIGSTGRHVRFLQRMIGGVTVDGEFGPETAARVRAYQKMRGIAADGIVGPRTWGEINKM